MAKEKETQDVSTEDTDSTVAVKAESAPEVKEEPKPKSKPVEKPVEKNEVPVSVDELRSAIRFLASRVSSNAEMQTLRTAFPRVFGD